MAPAGDYGCALEAERRKRARAHGQTIVNVPDATVIHLYVDDEPLLRGDFSLRFRDRQLRIALSHTVERYLVDEGEPISLTIRGTEHRLEPGVALELPLTGALPVARPRP